MKFKPTIQYCPLPIALGWRGDGQYLFEEKLDGQFHELRIGSSVVVGELLRSGEFYAFDIPVHNGNDVRRLPLRERLAILDTFRLLRPAVGAGGEFLRAVLARGGEGIVCKHVESPYGVGWAKCKRVETYDCRIVAMHASKNSVRLELDGQDAGWLPVFNHYESLRLGMTVEVAAMKRNASGKLREARFVRIRWDLMSEK